MTRYVVETVHVRSETISAVGVDEACRICQIDLELFHALVLEGVLEFNARDSSYWRLDPTQLATLKRAARLHRDLGVNPPGIALVLELMTMLDQTRRRP